ncbi:MAG: GNAT family N-acetyltransferase [Gammaproteobacteria bacterium]|nr:GNAT family N-acetyltransferase [Gammaproteobacteria bacterium]
MSNVNIRNAAADDSVALARFAKHTFLATYQEQNRPEHIQEYVSHAFSPATIGTELHDPAAVFLVAERDSRIIGYTKLREVPAPEGVPQHGAMEMERIYVARDYFGHGIGRMLVDAAVAQAVHRNFGFIWLGVWKQNPEAVAFYRKCGFEIVGSKVFMMGQDPQEDHVMLLTIKNVYDVGSAGLQRSRKRSH